MISLRGLLMSVFDIDGPYHILHAPYHTTSVLATGHVTYLLVLVCLVDL